MAAVKRSKYEIIIVVIVVGLSIALGASLYAGRSKVAKGNVLINELSNLRSSVALYKITNKKNPASLEDLVKAKYESNSVSHPYVSNVTIAKDNRPIDPFGNPYIYDPKSGWVKSSTRGYENW